MLQDRNLMVVLATVRKASEDCSVQMLLGRTASHVKYCSGVNLGEDKKLSNCLNNEEVTSEAGLVPM